jgi:ribosomal protein S12 methylthiotransferase accessory factor
MRAAAAVSGVEVQLDAEGATPCLGRVAGPDGEHRVVPLPRCPDCGGAAALAEPVWDPAEPLAGWVDPVTGVIPELSVDAGAPGLVVVTAAPPHVVDEDGSLRMLPVGWGKGLTPSDAVLSAVGEAVERYSASLPDPGRIVWARPDELDGDRLDPRSLPLYSDEQHARPGFPFARFDPGIAHPWVRGSWLAGGDVWVPAVLAFLSLTIEPAHLFAQGTSNGLAAATSPDDAARRGTLELVERDAMLAAWLTGTPGVRLELDGLDPPLAAVLAAPGGEVEVYALPTAVCGHVVLCVARGDGDSRPGVTIGLAADLDPATALRRAILELGQTGPYLRRLLETGAIEAPPDPAAVTGMLDHAAFYFPRERAAAFDFLRRGESVALAEFLARPAGSLDGLRVAVVDVTAPDVALGPFRVARAVGPDLQPLTYGHGLDREPVDRIRPLRPAGPVHPVW